MASITNRDCDEFWTEFDPDFMTEEEIEEADEYARMMLEEATREAIADHMALVQYERQQQENTEFGDGTYPW